jgi:hypothetical protein
MCTLTVNMYSDISEYIHIICIYCYCAVTEIKSVIPLCQHLLLSSTIVVILYICHLWWVIQWKCLLVFIFTMSIFYIFTYSYYFVAFFCLFYSVYSIIAFLSFFFRIPRSIIWYSHIVSQPYLDCPFIQEYNMLSGFCNLTWIHCLLMNKR